MTWSKVLFHDVKILFLCSCPRSTVWALLFPCTWGFKLAVEVKPVQVAKPTKAAERATGNERGKKHLLCQVLNNLECQKMWLRSWKVLKSRQWSPALRSISMKPFITTSSLSSSSSSSAQGSWHKESWRGSVFPQMLLLWLLNLAATLAIPQCPKLLKGSSVWWRAKK